MSNNSEAPYPNYNADDDYIKRLGIESTYHVNAPASNTRLNVLDEIANGKVPRGNHVFAKTDAQALEKGFDVKGDVDTIDTKTSGDLRKLILKTDSGYTLPYYVRHTEIVPAGDEPSVEGVNRYVVDKNLSFVAKGEGSSTSAPGTYLSLGETNLSPSYRFDPDTTKGAEYIEKYLDSTGTATVFLMPVDTKDEDGNATHDWYWCTNPTAAAPVTNSIYYELPFELSPQTQYDSGKEIMYLMNTVLQNAGLNDPNDEADAHSGTTGLPNLKVAYQALRSEYIKALNASSSSTEKTALDPKITYGQLHDKLITLLEGGTIAEGTIYEQTIAAQTDDYSASSVPDLTNTDYWEAAHVSVLGIEYAFLSYLQGWPMDGMDVFQGGTNRIASGFHEDNTRTFGARAMARILVAYAETARDNGLLDDVTANATFDLTTNDVTRSNGNTTVTVTPDTSNASSLSFKVPSGVTVESMTQDGASVSASSTSTADSGVTTYTFSDSASFPDSITLSTATTNETALRDDVLFTAVGATKTVAKAFVNSNDLYQDEETGHWVVREFVRASSDSSSSSATDKTGQEMSQTVFKFTPEYQSLHARINLTSTTEDTGSISVQKVWDNVDENKQEAVEFTLYQNGTAINTLTLNGDTSDDDNTSSAYEDSAWHGVFTNLDKTDDDGKAYTYTVKETTTSSNWELTDTQAATTYSDESTTVDGSYVGDATKIDDGRSMYSAEINDEDATVVYCLDIDKNWPNNTTYSSKIINATNDDLQSLLGSSSSTLKDNLLSVIYNGYSSDAAGIQDAYDLTVTEFQEVTQAAIWRYTESGWSTAPSSFTTNMQQAFYALIGEDNTQNITPATVPDGYALTVYKSSDSTYQDMLSATLVPPDTWTFTNSSVESHKVKVSKVNASGEGIDGASIQILDSAGNAVDSWTSDGSAHALSLEAGTYTFHEVSAPSNYLAVADFNFTVDADGTLTVNGSDAAKVNGSTLTVTDQVKKYDITFSKVDSDGNILPGASIQILDSDGEVVHSWTSTDENETVSLAAGTYTFHEVSAPEGYEPVDDFTFTVGSDSTVSVTSDGVDESTAKADGSALTVTDQDSEAETYKVSFSKVDAEGNVLTGASIQILDSTGNAVDSWTSDGSAHALSLEAGTYTFHEVSAPGNHAAVTDITFTVSDDGTVSITSDKDGASELNSDKTAMTVTDQDSEAETYKVTFSKVDVGNKNIEGAKIQILNSQGNVKTYWDSTSEDEIVGLEAGTYTFHEVSAPKGYERVKDFTFTVGSDGSVTVNGVDGSTAKADGSALTVTDQVTTHNVEFSKVDFGGAELSGASIQILDSDGNAVDSWTSDGSAHSASLSAGTYTFKETAAPEGYEAVSDITFSVDVNGKVKVIKASGNAVKAKGSKLIVTDQAKKHDVTVSKVDADGNELAGAKIRIKDGNGNAVASWTSTGENKTVRLAPGTYIFHEASAPDGYKAVSDITFSVDVNGKVKVIKASGNAVKAKGSKLIVTDQAKKHDVTVSKVDADGNELAGAKIRIKDGNGNAVASWTSTGENKTVRLAPGTYIFHEASAPDGYKAVSDITFTVDIDGKVKVTKANGNAVKASGHKLIVTDQADSTSDVSAEAWSAKNKSDNSTSSTDSNDSDAAGVSSSGNFLIGATGDSFMGPLIALIVLLGAGVACIVAYRRKRNNER
ncbi:MAG: SpaA isopeptide-forming pilin-related protein [Eggerthellaceae bacterium]